MIRLKTLSEIEIMKEGGKRLRKVVQELIPIMRPGITTEQIDNAAELLIKKSGGESSFKKVPHYRWSTCLSVNEEVVHTPPSKRILKQGDILTLDIGMFYGGFHTDYADTFIVGGLPDSESKKFLEVGKTTLDKALQQIKVGNRLGHISRAIQSEIYNYGYFVLKELTGHGVGRKLHEEPFIPGFLDRPIAKTPVMVQGLTIAVEVIYSKSTERIVHEQGNSWSIKTADGSMSACFEHTVAVTKERMLILT